LGRSFSACCLAIELEEPAQVVRSQRRDVLAIDGGHPDGEVGRLEIAAPVLGLDQAMGARPEVGQGQSRQDLAEGVVGDALGDAEAVVVAGRDLLGPALDRAERSGPGRHACQERGQDGRQRNVDLGGVARTLAGAAR
jgi:hypothetical protein